SSVAFAAQAVGAQSMSSPMMSHPSFGVMGGLNLASMGGSDASGLDSRMGFLVGGFAKFQVAPKIAIQPELFYTQKGAKQSMDDGNGGTVTLHIKPSYVELPVLARMDFSMAPDAGARPFILLGPTFALKAGCQFSASDAGASSSVGCSDAAEQLQEHVDAKSFDMGALAGAGIDLRAGAHTMSLGLRYEYGFTSVFDGSNVKNRALSFVVGFGF
ncbi:MAG TPA: porin family protein, partial [Gemmatimonadaceae bacterium]|nr:porin family protein [Gemmatimonadaceae bacterium]